ncbi:hypothetical protein [Clostridium sp. JN-1]|uniref:hypothetical protein n=1 Tax=Clostridium sp. JN-1 TaxID=2483110 RepID=UPI000F0B0B8D|nr:hypothetical protein [Clostridium sp. JN-1]
MSWYLILTIFIALLGAFTLAYQVYKLTELDARCRGLKHPKLWGLFSIGGNNSSGLLLYIIGRRKYKVTMNENERAEMNSRKKKAGVSLIFLAVLFR